MLNFIFLFFSHFNTFAEYRAFELTISDQVTNQSRVVLTTLDNSQYPSYYQVHKSERVQISATWMCRDRTDNFEPICARPPKPAPQSQSTSNAQNTALPNLNLPTPPSVQLAQP